MESDDGISCCSRHIQIASRHHRGTQWHVVLFLSLSLSQYPTTFSPCSTYRDAKQKDNKCEAEKPSGGANQTDTSSDDFFMQIR